MFMLFSHVGRKTAFSLQSATHWAPCFCGVHSKWWRPKRTVVCRAQLLPTLLLYSWLWWSLAAMTTRANHRSFNFFERFLLFALLPKTEDFKSVSHWWQILPLSRVECNESNAALRCAIVVLRSEGAAKSPLCLSSNQNLYSILLSRRTNWGFGCLSSLNRQSTSI